jgi:hypothetical protein
MFRITQRIVLVANLRKMPPGRRQSVLENEREAEASWRIVRDG